MNNKDLKNLLIDSLTMEKELREFCIDCLKHIYGDRAALPIHTFEEGIDFIEYNGSIKPFACIHAEFIKNEKDREGLKAKQKELDHDNA